MQRALTKAARGFLDQLFPPLCVQCRAQVSDPGGLCASCWAPIQFIEDPCCATCGLPFDLPTEGETRCASCHAEPPAYDRARAVMRYDDASRHLVLAFKHGDRTHGAPAFGEWMRRNLRNDRAVIFYYEQTTCCDFTDYRGIEAPFFEDVEDFVLASLFGDEEHALL